MAADDPGSRQILADGSGRPARKTLAAPHLPPSAAQVFVNTIAPRTMEESQQERTSQGASQR